MYKGIVTQLGRQKKLSGAEITFFLEASQKGELSTTQQATVLGMLQCKGVEASELSAFAHFLKKNLHEQLELPEAIDICGTGGSGLPRINTSTISAFILAALGVSVAKHGNKAVSGRFGSFDLLEKLGINIDLGKKELEQLGEQHQLSFIFARKFHPVMKHFGPVRREMGVPTVFNLLGPLLNPAGTKVQIIGTTFKDKMELIAQTAKKLGKERVMVVCGQDGLDEVTLAGKTFVTELEKGKIRSYTIKPSDFGVKPCDFAEIAGAVHTPKSGSDGSIAQRNVKIAQRILKGECSSRHLDLVLVNTALALKLAGKIRSLKKAYQIAKNCVGSGKAYQKFLAYRQASHTPSILLEIAAEKRKEVERSKKALSLAKLKKKVKPSDRDFKAGLSRSGVSLIAEVKKASPSAGNIRKGSFAPAKIAQAYELAGARAISVLTDKKYFQGDLKYLQQAREATKNAPLLRKDFIIDAYQIYEARYYGADAVLLIAALLSVEEMEHFLNIARELKMDCLCEVHTEEELKKVLKTSAEIIGVNNRNLHRFVVDLKTTQRLARKIPKGKILVAESGIHNKTDLKKLPKKTDAILVGTSLMKSKNVEKKIRSLVGKPRPLINICGVQTEKEALLCQKLGVDFMSLNFVPTSRRRISYQAAARIVKAVRKNPGSPMKIAGVFQDHSEDEVYTAVRELGLDYVKLHGKESMSFIKNCPVPVIKGIAVTEKADIKKAEKYFPHVSYLLFDGRQPGSGEPFNYKLLKGCKLPYLIAGGINKTNAKTVLSKTSAIGIDVASGVETRWRRDPKKITQLVKHLWT